MSISPSDHRVHDLLGRRACHVQSTTDDKRVAGRAAVAHLDFPIPALPEKGTLWIAKTHREWLTKLRFGKWFRRNDEFADGDFAHRIPRIRRIPRFEIGGNVAKVRDVTPKSYRLAFTVLIVECADRSQNAGQVKRGIDAPTSCLGFVLDEP